MTHISTDHSNISQNAPQDNIDIKKHYRLITVKNSAYIKDSNIKDKKLSIRNIYINNANIIEIYDKLSNEFLVIKQKNIPMHTRHIQQYDNYC